MQYRRFGRTELAMPVFSCGGMRYQQSWQDVPLDQIDPQGQRNLEATIDRALELGINHIETARGYGSSERQLGLVLPNYPREQIIVQTKIAPTADPQEFARHFRESLERLRLEYVDLLAIHGVNNYQMQYHAIRPGGCLSVAREFQREGKARHIGFSTHGSPELILDTLSHEGDGGFDYVNLHWYYIYQRNWPAIELATARDMGVFIISPADKGGMLYRPSERLSELCAPLHPLVFNCLFCLARPEVHTLSLGAARPSDFDLQLTALEHVGQAQEIVAPIVARLDQALVEAVGQELATAWWQGLPDWEYSPGYMNLPIMLWLRNLVLAFDMVEYGRMRYNLLGQGGHWFPGLNATGLQAISDEALVKAVKASPWAEQIREFLQQLDGLVGGEAVTRLSQS